MRYADILKEYLQNCPYTLQGISEFLKQDGFNVDKSYLSKLQNGKVPPASNELNRAFARIIGVDPEYLMRAAYIEKAPDELRPNIETAEMLTTLMHIAKGISTKMEANEYVPEGDVQEFCRLADKLGVQIDADEFISNPVSAFVNLLDGLSVKFNTLFIISPDAEKIETFPYTSEMLDLEYRYKPKKDEFDLNNLTKDEESYLVECLKIYRNMHLKPQIK